MTNHSDDETFFSRWSRQKRAKPTPDKRMPAAPSSDTQDPDKPFDLTKLPSIDDLTADSDITAFLQKGVPEALKKLALRRMWSLDPAIRDFVEIAENQWDFNASGGIYGLYQDIAEGSDMSLWIAQAAQSTPFKDQKPKDAVAHATDPAEPPSDPSPIPTEVAVQQDTAAKTPPAASAPPSEPSPQVDRQPIVAAQSQVAEMSTQHSPTEASTQHESAPSRRRHGGALPS